MSFDGPLSSLPKAHGQPHGPRGHYIPLPPLSVALLSSTHWCVGYCTFTDPVQVFLVLLQTVTGLAVSYVPIAGYRVHTRLTLTVK